MIIIKNNSGNIIVYGNAEGTFDVINTKNHPEAEEKLYYSSCAPNCLVISDEPVN